MGFGNWLKERKDKRKSEEFLVEKLSEVLQKMEIPAIIDLCKNIIGSVPSDGLKVENKKRRKEKKGKSQISALVK